MTAFDQLHPQSRVWVYQASRALLPQEVAAVDQALEQFTAGWTAHDKALKAYGKVHHARFIVLMVDETQATASGCSIDKSVRFLQAVEDQLGISLFDRLFLACQTATGIEAIHRNDLEDALRQGIITADTLVFNNMVQTRAEWETGWQIPLRQSWAWQQLQA